VAGRLRDFDGQRLRQGRAEGKEAGEAKAVGAEGVICTEKDSFNYRGVWRSMDLWVCSISMQVDRQDDFWRTVMEMAERTPDRER
jgi:hypothetical protein